MIYNKKQLAITQKKVETLKEHIVLLLGSDSMLDQMQVDMWEGRLEALELEIKEYNELTNHNGNLKFSLDNIEKVIPSLRIASNYTQQELAARTGLTQQQINRYEQQDYLKANFERIIQMLKILSNELTIDVRLKNIPMSELPINDNEDSELREIKARFSKQNRLLAI